MPLWSLAPVLHRLFALEGLAFWVTHSTVEHPIYASFIRCTSWMTQQTFACIPKLCFICFRPAVSTYRLPICCTQKQLPNSSTARAMLQPLRSSLMPPEPEPFACDLVVAARPASSNFLILASGARFGN